MALPETRYAMSGDVAIAYQIVSDGPFDVVWVPGAVSNVELNWQDERSSPARVSRSRNAARRN